MKSIIGLLYIMAFLASPMALADDIFVREAHGVGLTQTQCEEITRLVETAVRQIPDQKLVSSESLADFVLEPSITTRDGRLALRVDKIRNGEIVASGIEPLPHAKLNSRHAHAATENALLAEETISGTTMPADTEDESVAGHHPAVGVGDVRAPSPIFHGADRKSSFQIALGPAFSTGMATDQLLYNVNLAYALPVHEYVSLKGIGDFNLSAGSESTQFMNFGLGADLFPMGTAAVTGGRPYLTGDVGYAFIRNKNDASTEAPAVGLGGGYKFVTEALNMDVNLHYTILTAQLQDETPAILGLRAAINF